MKKRIAIKLGGASLENLTTLEQLAGLIKGLSCRDNEVIVIHGGGPAINKALTDRNISWQFINGQRQTTTEMMSVIEEVLAKQINGMIVQSLVKQEISAVGISGASNNTLFCSQASAELMQVGKIETVNAELIEKVLNIKELNSEKKYVPVVAPIGVGVNGEKYNINADWAAAQIAIALKADSLIFLTDQDGILDQDKNLIHVADTELINKLIADNVIFGGMYTKVKTMIAALNSGIQKVRVLNASAASRFLQDENLGTLLVSQLNDQIKDQVNTKKDVASWNHQVN